MNPTFLPSESDFELTGDLQGRSFHHGDLADLSKYFRLVFVLRTTFWRYFRPNSAAVPTLGQYSRPIFVARAPFGDVPGQPLRQGPHAARLSQLRHCFVAVRSSTNYIITMTTFLPFTIYGCFRNLTFRCCDPCVVPCGTALPPPGERQG